MKLEKELDEIMLDYTNYIKKEQSFFFSDFVCFVVFEYSVYTAQACLQLCSTE